MYLYAKCVFVLRFLSLLFVAFVISESPDSTGEMIEDTTSPTIRNDTELSRQMFNNAAMANGGHAGNGQVVALPGKSIDDDGK